jgi:hypothetical protein
MPETAIKRFTWTPGRDLLRLLELQGQLMFFLLACASSDRVAVGASGAQ